MLLQELGDSDQGYQPIARFPDRRVEDDLVELVLGGQLDPCRVEPAADFFDALILQRLANRRVEKLRDKNPCTGKVQFHGFTFVEGRTDRD